MTSSLAGRTLCLVGGSGFVGRNVAREASNLGAKVLSVSLDGKPPILTGEPWEDRVKWIKGDALRPNSLESVFKDSEAVVHTIETKFDTSLWKGKKPGEEGTYEHLHFETAKAIGDKLNELKGKKMVYLSASKSVPFIPRYLSTKREAEEYLFSLKNIKTSILRPGFIYSDKVPLTKIFSYLHNSYTYLFRFINGITPYESTFKQMLKNVETDFSIEVRAVAISAVVCCFDQKLDGKILVNEDMEEIRDLFYEKGYEFPIQ
jgi:nucleoside-diphosphate-sugar epimerase